MKRGQPQCVFSVDISTYGGMSSSFSEVGQGRERKPGTRALNLVSKGASSGPTTGEQHSDKEDRGRKGSSPIWREREKGSAPWVHP